MKKVDYAQEFKEVVESAGYELLSEYVNSKTKVKLKCNKGHEYEVTPTTFKSGNRCLKCSGYCPIQAKEKLIEVLHQKGYELIGEYVNSKTKVKLKCDKGHIYEAIPASLKKGSNCPVCSGQCPIQSKERFFKLLDKEGYELIGDYKKSSIKVILKCPKGHVWTVRPNDFRNGIRCKRCYIDYLIQIKDNFIVLLQQEGYELIGDYINASTKVKLKCPKGGEWEVAPTSFKGGVRCPKWLQ